MSLPISRVHSGIGEEGERDMEGGREGSNLENTIY